ncbi:DUF4262 domain-containing protein [Kitasatospora sp. NBC_00240]|uniref:DUF4262 domain-containing protein n=1 Tax=Kitasatospora sp. NBC_00240 TaxID=2903567 RepID=UPI00225281E2|nr:DUF4262 domain-containing protein [Kitasatospora sp. NBC_00240]MCX5208095.1 DUF4262 domain-containing protein [Kitasatospora sp. NBC_00240]
MTDLPEASPCPCVLCDPAAAATFRARRLRRKHWGPTMARVREQGWQVVGVGGGGELPDWAFTVGLWHSYRIPEVAMFGLELHGLMHWVGDVAALLRDGASTEPGTLLPDVVEGYRLRLQPVEACWHRPLFGTAVGFYRRVPVPVVQLLWPDREHRWPSDPLAGPGCRAQPDLSLPVDEHPKGLWTDEAAAV